MAGRTSQRRALKAIGAVLVGLGALSVAACAPIMTDVQYAPSDGTRVVLGDELTVENLLVLTTAEGEPALVVGAVTNRNGERSDVTFAFGDTGTITTSVQVGPNETVYLDPAQPDGETMVLDASPEPPGASLPVTVSTPVSGSTTVQVTVLDGTLPPYDEYLTYLDDVVVPAS